MHIKFCAVVDELRADRWQVMAERDGRDFLFMSGLTRKAALAHIRTAEKAALLSGATVIA